MVGAFGVGKTSLVARFVRSIFSDKYLTTLGVKIDKKTVNIDGQEMTLMLWDLAGEDALTQIKPSPTARVVRVHPGGGWMPRQHAGSRHRSAVARGSGSWARSRSPAL